MDTPTQVLTLGETFRLFEDPDKYEIVEVPFSNGSNLLMHQSQWQAIAYAIASDTKLQGVILENWNARMERDAQIQERAAKAAIAKRAVGRRVVTQK